jgi:hypothetical protein
MTTIPRPPSRLSFVITVSSSVALRTGASIGSTASDEAAWRAVDALPLSATSFSLGRVGEKVSLAGSPPLFPRLHRADPAIFAC